MSDKMLDIQIVRALNSGGSLTRNQIIGRVSENKLDVEASLDALVTMGCLRSEPSEKFKEIVEYTLRKNFGESDCKRMDHRQKVALYVSRHGSGIKEDAPDSAVITFSDGLDRAIWKAVNTGRWMMVREMRDILTTVGFRRDDVVSRIQHHINTGKWFERQGGHRNNQFFMLREDVECPEIYGQKPKKKPVAPVAAPEAMIASNLGPIMALLAPKGSETSLVNDGYFPLSILCEDAIKVAHEQTKLLVNQEGTLSEAVWAILSDTEEYSSTDLVTLLRPFGYTSGQISPLLSKRFADGLLSRRLVEVSGRWINVYKKAAELPEKYTMAKSVVSAIVEAQQQTEVKVIAVNQEVAKEPEIAPVLFDTRIHIKGVEIDINEFGNLYKDLSDAGFVRDMHKATTDKPVSRLLTTTHRVKGIVFSREELQQLCQGMYAVANRFKLSLVV